MRPDHPSEGASSRVRELFVLKDERWSSVGRVETVEDAYRFFLQRYDATRAPDERATIGRWSLWREAGGDQREILPPGVLAAQAEAWDVAEGDRADRDAGAREIRRERGEG